MMIENNNNVNSNRYTNNGNDNDYVRDNDDGHDSAVENKSSAVIIICTIFKYPQEYFTTVHYASLVIDNISNNSRDNYFVDFFLNLFAKFIILV